MRKISEIKLNIPKYPRLIIETLKKAGYSAYIVGGCVRDELLNKTPTDFDITTNAKPQEIKKLFRKTIDTGLKHGTVTLVFYENNIPMTYEVTTYRIDGEYEDARHPKNVSFTDDLQEDLLRRDFTINAMAYNDTDGLVDKFGGLVDLEKKLIRAVGDPKERFTEDALRLMRAVRFSAKLGFSIEYDTKDAIPVLAPNLSRISKERVQVELIKTLLSDNPEYAMEYFKLGLAPYIAKDFEKIVPGKIFVTSVNYLAYASLLYNTSVEKSFAILKELKLDNDTIRKTLALLGAKQMYKDFVKSKSKNVAIFTKSLINYLRYDIVYDFLTLITENERNVNLINNVKKLTDEYRIKKIPIFVSDLKINGNDLMKLGFVGEEIGIALNSLQSIIHKNFEYNDNNKLKEISKKALKLFRGAAYEL